MEYSHDHLVAEDRDASPMNHSNATYISDLRVCAPAAALSTGHLKYHWQTVPYEAEGVSGTLLIADSETEAAP